MSSFLYFFIHSFIHLGHLLQAHIGPPALDCKPTSGHLLYSAYLCPRH
jgi:hypothetical protein